MKLVRFENGKFGVRRGIWPFWKFKSFLVGSEYWWSPRAIPFVFCMTDEETARKFLVAASGKHEVVK